MGDYTGAERQRRYIARLKAAADTPKLAWTIMVDDDHEEGYLSAHEGPWCLYVYPQGNEFFWAVVKDEYDETSDGDGEASTLVSAMADAEAYFRSIDASKGGS